MGSVAKQHAAPKNKRNEPSHRTLNYSVQSLVMNLLKENGSMNKKYSREKLESKFYHYSSSGYDIDSNNSCVFHVQQKK